MLLVLQILQTQLDSKVYALDDNRKAPPVLVAEGQDHLGHDGRIMVQQSMQLAQGRQHCKTLVVMFIQLLMFLLLRGLCSGEGTALGVRCLCDNYNHLLYMHAKY